MSDAGVGGKGRLLLVDGNSLAYRAFFALPDSIATDQGFPTNALYGLASMTVRVLADERPLRGIVAWDAPGKVFRHEVYPEYKAGRRKTPDLLREQSPRFRPLMAAFGFANVEAPGFEADDVIGTLAERAAVAGEEVVILTGDRDAFQLVRDGVSVLATGRGVTDTTEYTPDAVRERYGVGPELMVDFRGMVGDTSDNLPGVPGIGEKGAAALIAKYGNLEGVLAHAEEQTPKRREALIEHAEDARITRDLAVIKTDVDLGDFDLAAVEPLDFGAERLATLAEAFEELQFATLAGRLSELGEAPVPTESAPAVLRRIDPVEIAPEEVALRATSTGRIGLAVGEDRWALALGDDEVAVGARTGDESAALAAGLAGTDLACHDAKSLPAALRDAGVRPSHDTMVAAYLLEPRRRGYALPELAEAEGIAVEGTEDDVAVAAVTTRELAVRQAEGIAREGLVSLFNDVEMPLVDVLASMERTGIVLDVARLGEIAARVRDRVDELRDEIWDQAGGEFVIESPKQLGEVLFERLGLPTYRKGKTGWSTDRQVLKLLADKHPIIEMIGRYRELTKLDNTYLSTLPELVGPDGRIHTTFNQAVAETGRLSSTNPNLQNIPVRTELGREIRDAFVTDPGWTLISCDYSQVELRVLAHCSGEPALAEAFRRGEDIHRATAAEVFGMQPADVDRTTRDRAKAVNFGIVYGISDFGLSEQLSISREDARAYIEAYLDRYPLVRRFIDTTIAEAAQSGQVTTLFGRRRAIPELSGRTVQQRQLGERLAVNTVIQGTAADIIKVAMVRTQAALAEQGLRSRLVLQIHDELVVEAPEEEAAGARALVREAMAGAYDLDPALAVDTGSGATWLQAKA